MSKTITPEKLVLYYFNETGMADSVIVQREIDNDPDTEFEYEYLKRAFRYIDRALVNPPRRCIDNILKYAADTAVPAN